VTEQISFNDWADFWRYKIGVNVIPAVTKYKKPRAGIYWREWQQKPITDEQHESWKKQGAFDEGMAIIVGRVWHRKDRLGCYLAAIDCDNEAGIRIFCQDSPRTSALKTLIEQHPDNPNKCHIYFYTPKIIPKKSSDSVNPRLRSAILNNEIPGIEIKGDGSHGIMYVTPSPHEGGTNYEIIGIHEPDMLDADRTDHLLSIIQSRLAQFGLSWATDTPMMSMRDILDDSALVQQGHNRHEAILRYAESIYATAPPTITDQVVFEMVKAKNTMMCDPPLDESDLRRQVRDAKNFILRQNGSVGAYHREPDSKVPKNHAEIADLIMDSFNFATMEDNKEIYWYHEGVYIPNGEVIIEKQCEHLIPMAKRDIVAEVVSTIKRRTYTPRTMFDADIEMINCRNCWVNIRTGVTSPHTPRRLSKVQIPVFFDPTKDASRFEQFLSECLPDDEDRFTVLEQFASCLIKSAKFGKAFIMIGQGANGKSTFLNIIQDVLGPQNVANISIHAFEDNRFAKAELDGKLANIYADISNEELNTVSEFKALVTGDTVLAEKKNQHPFQLNNFAKMFFSANQIPIVYDESDGFFRRFMIIEWNVRFTDQTAKINLKSELLTEDEKSGILNLLLRYAAQLEERGYFLYAESVEKLKARWKEKANSAQGFLDTQLSYDEQYIIPKSRLESAYKQYCADNKLYPLSSRKFNDYLRQFSVLVDDLKPHRIDNKSVRVWIGATLKRDMLHQTELNQ
jgi:putative DNA primase/helicase